MALSTWTYKPSGDTAFQALTVSDIDELRTALSLDSIEEVYVWLQGCGASGRHDIDASRALLGSTVAKKCFFGPDWDNVELLSFGGLKPGNKSARAVYVRTDPDTGEQSQESYQCGGVIGRRTCDCATAEEQVALYALRNVAETVMRSVLPAGEHRERGLRPWYVLRRGDALRPYSSPPPHSSTGRGSPSTSSRGTSVNAAPTPTTRTRPFPTSRRGRPSST